MSVTGTGATAADREVEADARASALPRWVWGLRRFLAPGVEPEPPPEESAAAARQRAAGRVLLLLSIVPALIVAAWLVAAYPLVVIGEFRRITVLPLFVLLAAVLVWAGVRLVVRRGAPLYAPRWAVVATVLIAVAFAVFAGITHSEDIVIHRDNSSYAQIGYWLAHNHGLDTQVPGNAYGSATSLVYFTSPAYYQVGDQLVPQFMTGWPTMLAGGNWLAGWTGELIMPAIVGAFALLALGGLTARLVGARWAPLAVGVTALAFPIIKGSQTTFSEIPAMLLLAAAIGMLVDMIRVTSPGSQYGATSRTLWPYAAAAGLVFGVSELIRLDAGVDFAVLLPAIGWLWASRRPGVWPYLAGAVFGLLLGGLDARFQTWPYTQGNWSSVKLEMFALAASAIATFVVAFLARNAMVWPGHRRWWRWMPLLGAGAVALIGLVLFVRPYVMTARQSTTIGAQDYLQSLQTWNQVPVDGTRSYAEQSLRWVSWYVGWPLLLAALVAGAVLAWRVLRGRAPGWTPALLLYIGSGALELWRPTITPDHPYADRRLVTVILPGVILLATYTAALLTRAVRKAAPGVWGRLNIRLTPVVATVLVLAFLVPTVIGSAPVAWRRVAIGEVAATQQVCASLNKKHDSVVLIDAASAQWMASIRNECGVPVAQLTEAIYGPNGSQTNMTIGQINAAIATVEADIRAVGRTPVIASSGADALQQLGYPVPRLQQVVVLTTNQDEQTLTTPPTSVERMGNLEFWYVKP